MRSKAVANWIRLCAALSCSIVIAACGGGAVGSGGTGVVPQGVAVGTVNGFGSVIIDGIRFDDRNTAAVEELEPGNDVVTEVQLGERVEVAFEQAGVAKTLRVDAALAGPVSSIVNAAQFVVLGQTVEVNASVATGPVTQFAGGYMSAADVMPSDAVEVHGPIARRGTSFVIQATRIEKKAALPTYLKVTGLISDLGSGGAAVFKLGELSVDAGAAAVLPAGRNLANGQVASVLALPSALSAPAGGTPTLGAAQVRVRDLPSDGSAAYVGGSVAALDTTAYTFQLDGLTVSYGSAVVAPSAAALADGTYVRVRGNLLADGSLAAASVTVRDGHDEPEAELKGNIVRYDAATQTFTVRDVVVDASQATLEGCPASGLADGLYVAIEGSLSTTKVIAKTVHCQAEPSGATVEREGTAATVDTTAMTFVLNRSGTPSVAVSWTALTFFRNLTPQTLEGKRIEVVGTFANGVLEASAVKLDD